MNRTTLAFAVVVIVAVAVAVGLWRHCRNPKPKSVTGTTKLPDPPVAPRPLLIHAGTRDDSRDQQAVQALVDAFDREYPDIKPTIKHMEHNALEEKLEQILGREETAGDTPDVFAFLSGERLQQWMQQGHLEDASAVWREQGLEEAMAPWHGTMTFDGRQYGIPYIASHWTVYVRKDLFEQHGVAVPTSWSELQDTCRTLHEKEVAPFAMATRYREPAAAWFEYLVLRQHGAEFHARLMAGDVAYDDDRMVAVLDRWRELLRAGCFMPDHERSTWMQAMDAVKQGQAAMFLFTSDAFAGMDPDERAKFGALSFPPLASDVARYEFAPVRTLHVPRNAGNKADALKFLAFAATPGMQTTMSEIWDQIPPHREARSGDPLMTASAELIHSSAGSADDYIEGTHPGRVKPGREALREFMAHPERLNQILARLEQQRQQIAEKPDSATRPASPR